MRSARLPVLLVLFGSLSLGAACTKPSERTAETSKSAASVSAGPTPSASVRIRPADAGPISPPTVTTRTEDAGAAVAWPASLPKPNLPTDKKPIAVAGYPIPLRTCLPDPAHHAGFTKDGREFGYCTSGMMLTCEFVDKDGKLRHQSAGIAEHTAQKGDAQKVKEMEGWLASEGVFALPSRECQYFPQKLEGSWRFSDITLSVMPIEASFKKTSAGDEPQSEATVKIGGSIAGDNKPVYPIILGRPGRKANEPARYSNGTEVNALALSPDGNEIGIVTHTNCMEWCDEFEIVRMSVERFASLVYNDVGFRYYKANDLDRALDYFARAAYLDETRELPAYNLACVYAKKKDKNAEAALDLAIKRGGDPVKKRAQKDADFALVKSEPWFTKLTN